MREEAKQNIYQHQNVVREAVHALLASEDLVGGIGQQVSAVAREFNNSVDKTIQAEEKIRNRHPILKWIIGGVKDAAEEINQEVEQNRNRIELLKQLQEQNWISSEVKAILVEQIQNMEEEQNRLEEMAQQELKTKGIVGWFLGLFK